MASFPLSSGKAICKSVISGDTIIIRGKPSNGGPPEAILQLSMINSPRSSKEQEEKFAFESREFLRELLVGKEIAYTIEYTSPSNRHIGTASIPIEINQKSDLGKIIVSNGWARVKPAKSPSEYQVELQNLEDEAKGKEEGIWKTANYIPAKVAYNWEQSIDPRAFIQGLKSNPVTAVIEQVRNGSTFRCILLLEGCRQWITLSLSGISCPILRKGIPNMEDLVEPFAEEAQYFVESRLLQKKVDVRLESVAGGAGGSQLSFYGTILHPKGNISEILLSEGFARVVDWNLGIVQNGKLYQNAEAAAQKKRMRIWKDYKIAASSKLANDGKEYPAIVTRIISPDILVVSPLKNPGEERKVGLSSIRGPRRMKNEAGNDVGYFFEAQEFLRSRLIGSKVLCKTDYVKPKDGEFEERECVTVLKNDKNIAEVLVKMGYANVIKHKKDDNNRSASYDLLLAAEEEAKTAEKGIHSVNKEPPVIRIVDASENVTKARSFISQLQRHGNIKGIVEYVWSASRFKIWLPSHNCRVTFILAGVITPRPPGSQGQKGEPWGVEAQLWCSRKIFQREVEISVEGQDKVGGFIGSLFLNQQQQQSNLGVLLLEEGFASTHHYSASQSPTASQLFAAESTAQSLKRGIWLNYKSTDLAVEANNLALEEKSAGRDAIVSEISKVDRKIYLQYCGEDLNQLASLMKEFAIHHASASRNVSSPYLPKVGDYCSAQFSADKQWYRARIVKAVQNRYTVLYIDYGNSEELPGSRLSVLPSNFGVAKLKAQAVESNLAFIELPGAESEFGPMAYDALCHFTEGQTLKAHSYGSLGVLLLNSDGVSVQELLIREGLATITKMSMKKYQMDHRQKLKNPSALLQEQRNKKQDDLDNLVSAQEETSRKRLGVWEYGDLGLYDEE